MEESKDQVQQKRLKLRPLTKYEQDLMLKSRAMHKQNIVKEQKCWGKTFQGAAFLPKPEKIEFKDFELGQSYTQTITMTNVSFTFNSFKLLPLDNSIKDFFVIQFSPPGRMSAGLSCNITIIFTPQVNEDIIGVFPILAETGQIDIPLVCMPKKVNISAENYVIDFKQVILGEFQERSLILRNDGALESDFRILDRNGDIIPSISENQMITQDSISLTQSDAMGGSIDHEMLAPDSFFAMLKFKRSGRIGGYKQRSIKFVFTPTNIGDFEEEILLSFNNTESLKVLVKGECIDVPLYVESNVCDFQVCVMNHTYREKIVLRNRSINPMKIQLKYPKDARDHLEFSPTLGYIQGNDKFEIWCKFRPDNMAAVKLASFAVTTNMYKIPIKIIGANQVRSVPFDVITEVTVDNITFDPPLIDFGEVFVSQGAKQRFILRSLCELPQEYAFVKLPTTFSIQPNDGFGTILPNEEIEMEAIYRPAPVKPGIELGKDTNDLSLRVKTGDICAREFKLPYTVKLKHCPLKISPQKIDFPALPIQESCELLISITNVSKKLPYQCELILPDYSIAGLTAAPLVIPRLSTGETQRIMLKFDALFRDFNPPIEEQEEEEKEEQSEKEEVPRLTQEEIDQKLKEMGGHLLDFDQNSPSQRTQHWNWVIPLCFKSLTQDSSTKRAFIQVKTTVVNKVLLVDSEVIDFGEVAVSSRKLLPLSLTNSDERPAKVRMDPMPPFSGFSIINALREIQPGSSQQVILEFEPVNQQYFEEILTLRSDNSSVSVKLKGRGVRPLADVEPHDCLLDMANCIPGDTIERVFKVTNNCTFAFNFSLKRIGQGVQNYNGLPNFIYMPSSGEIQPGEAKDIRVKFCPDHVSAGYFDYILVDVPNQLDPKELYIAGKCWPRSAFIRKDMPYIWPTSTYLSSIPTESNFAFLKSQYSQNQIILSFTQQEQERHKKISIGNCKLNDSKLEKPVNFEVNLAKVEGNIFSIDVPKGTVAAGQEGKVGFTFTPPQPDPLIHELEVLQGVGQWVECIAEVKISGGFIPPGVPDTFTAEIILRAYLEQI